MKRKVIAYIFRRRAGSTELLVFEHADFDAGIQVPKGTVDESETTEDTIRREVREESGLVNLGDLTHLGSLEYRGEEWNFFAAMMASTIRNEWEHRVGGSGDDRGMLFRFYWLPLATRPNLAGDQGSGLNMAQEFLANHPE